MKDNKPQQKLIALGCLLIAALQYPLVSFFSVDDSIGGIPVLVIYLLTVWLIGLIFLFRYTRRIAPTSDKQPHE